MGRIKMGDMPLSQSSAYKAASPSQKRFTPKLRKQRERVITTQPYSSPARISAALFSLHGVSASTSTIRRDLIALNKRALRKRTGPYLTPQHMAARVSFAKDWLRRRRRQKLIFSDEKIFDSNQRSAEFQWVGPDERADPSFKEQGAPSVLVWAAIGPGGFRCIRVLRRVNLNRETYKTLVLRPALSQLRQQCVAGAIFMQDNARPHCGTDEFLRANGISLLEYWPSLSCDLNCIEQFWSILNRRVKSRHPWGEEELVRCIEEEAMNIPNSIIEGLVGSFLGRLQKVVESKGQTIKP